MHAAVTRPRSEYRAPGYYVKGNDKNGGKDTHTVKVKNSWECEDIQNL